MDDSELLPGEEPALEGRSPPTIHGRTPAEWVAPRVDTAETRWLYFASASRPFGLVNLSPDTVTDGTWDAGYVYGEERVRAFSHVHAWQLAGVPVMATTGPFEGHEGMDAYASDFAHDDETVAPGYHRLELEDYGITAELTATHRVGLHRYTFPDADRADVLFDTGAFLAHGDVTHTEVRRTGAAEIAGHSVLEGTRRRPKDTPVFFVARFDRPFEAFGGWQGGDGEPREDVDRIAGEDAGAFVRYDPDEGDQVVVRVGISYTGIEGARRNLEAEAADRGFEAVRESATAEWNRWLGRIEVEGGTDRQRTKFYTDLWHALQGRRVVSDADGRYSDFTGEERTVRRVALDDDGDPRFHHHQHDAWWGSHWNLNVLWSMAYPEVVDSFCNTGVRVYEDGGLIPRGPSGGNYTYVMIGDTAAPLFAAAWNKGIRGFDAETAYEGLRKNAFPGGIRDRAGYEHAEPARGGGMEAYVEDGYVPADVEADAFHTDGASMTMEYAYQDWSLAQFARALGREDDAERFEARARNYRRLWDEETGYVRPRTADGEWLAPFDPLGEGFTAEDFTEANAAIYTHFVPHDVAGLIDLFGGRERYAERLQSAFEDGAEYGFVSGRKEHAGTPVDYGNQPGLHLAHLFNYAGQPWRAQEWVRRVKREAYGEVSPYGGYNGDEDQGQMGALSALMAMGLFSVRGGAAVDPVYEVTAPVFDAVTVHLADDYYGGDRFVVRTENNAPEHHYVRAARLDGDSLERPWFRHDRLAAGGRLELELGPEPERSWGSAPGDAPPSMSDEGGRESDPE